MTVQFLKDHVMADGTRHLQGEVATVSLGVGNSLVQAGIARERHAPAPTERKAT